MQVIPFDDIVPGAIVRFTEIDGKQYLSVRDLIMCLCGTSNDYAGKVYRDMPVEHKNEVRAWCTNFQFPGRGQSSQPVITFPGALKLAMFMPGENAKKSRLVLANILQRYYAGDESLVAEIRANAASTNPIMQMARASLESDQSPSGSASAPAQLSNEIIFERALEKLRLDVRCEVRAEIHGEIEVLHQHIRAEFQDKIEVFRQNICSDIRAEIQGEVEVLHQDIGGLKETVQGLHQKIAQKTATDKYILKAKLKAERTAHSLAQIKKGKLTKKHNAEIKELKQMHAQQLKDIQESLPEAVATVLLDRQLVVQTSLQLPDSAEKDHWKGTVGYSQIGDFENVLYKYHLSKEPRTDRRNIPILYLTFAATRRYLDLNIDVARVCLNDCSNNSGQHRVELGFITGPAIPAASFHRMQNGLINQVMNLCNELDMPHPEALKVDYLPTDNIFSRPEVSFSF